MVTKRQKEVLNFIEKYKKKKDYAPSLEDIKKHLKLSSVSTVHYHIKKLEKLGLLRKNEHQPRSMTTTKEKQMMSVPIVGTIAAGQPIEAIEIPDGSVLVDSRNYSSNDIFYALRVAGDSMIEEGIFDKDVVVIKKQSSAENGQTVVAIIDDNEATLKKLYRLENRFKLVPANQTMLPFYRKEVEVRGVVVNIIRNLEPKKRLRTLDLFAGIGAYSFGEFSNYEIWEISNSPQTDLFKSNLTDMTFSPSQEEKFNTIKLLNNMCKSNKLSVALDSTKGFKSHNSKAFLNFWTYGPQHDMDKAPTRQ